MRQTIANDESRGGAAQNGVSEPILSIGVTTYNNSSNITQLLNSLHSLALESVPVFVYDDCSSDGTIEIIHQHPIAALDNFRLDVAAVNSGGPLAGRKAMAGYSQTEYITFIDGDDELNSEAFLSFANRIPSQMDMVMTPYRLYGRDYCPAEREGELVIDDSSITLAASGIGGRIYSVKIFLECAPDYYVPRAEDAHVNLAIMGNSKCNPHIFVLQGAPFYIIHAGTKSKSTKRIVLDELQKRRQLYDVVRGRFGLGNEYLLRSKAFLLSVIKADEEIDHQKRRLLIEQVESTLTPRLTRIVLACNDPSVLGGVASRVNLSMAESRGRETKYSVISLRNENRISDERYISCENSDLALKAIASWDRASTAIIVQAAILRNFPLAVRKALEQFPIVYYGDAQTAALLQTKAYYNEKSFFENFRASSALSLSNADISFQRQLGVHGQKHTVLPVLQREKNTYRRRKRPIIGYVGVSDFRFKATDRMIEVAIAAKRRGLPPIHIFTSDAANSPDFKRLTQKILDGGVRDHIVIHLNESDKDRIFEGISILYVPSKNEAGGTVVLEALSYGVPVAGHSYAPAVNEAVTDGVDGYIFNEYDPFEIVDRIAHTTASEFRLMSAAAFAKHRQYSAARHLADIEAASNEAIARFSMKNELRVFPILEWAGPLAVTGAAINTKKDVTASRPQISANAELPQLLALEKRVASLERSFPLRLTRKMKWMKKYIRVPF